MNTKYKVLHLEDMPSDAELVARELRHSFDFDHLVIDTEAAYVEALNNFLPDIILCDHSLPSFNSFEALAILRKKKLQIPFIIITATMSEEIAVSVVKDGADDYILKDRLKRLPSAVLNAVNKYQFEKDRKIIIDDVKASEVVANETLKKLSNKLQLATKVSGVGIWELNAGSKKFIWDDVMFSIYEVKQNEFDCSYEAWKKKLHPKDVGAVDKKLKEALLTGIEFNTEFRILTENKLIKYIKLFCLALKDENDKTIGLIGTNQDVTKQKESELAIKESEAKYKSFFENSMDGIILLSSDKKIEEANNAACSIFQRSEIEMCNEVKEGLMDVSDKRFVQFIDERNRNGKAKGEIIFKRKDGSTFPGEVTSGVYKDIYGYERASVIVRDIADRKTAEEKLKKTTNALQHSLNEIKRIMDFSLDVICTIDEDGKFVQVSSASERLWGFKPKELIGKKYIDLVYHEDVEKTNRTGNTIMKGISVTMFENRYVHKNASLVPVLWSATWVEEEKLMYCIAKDASEKKKLESAVESERQRFYEMFLSAPASLGIMKGPDHVFEMVNEPYLKLTGRKNIIGKTVKEVFPEIENQGLIDLLNQVYTTGKSFIAKEKLIKLDTEENGILQDIYLNFIYQVYRNNKNEIEGIFFFAIDVTEQVKSRKIIEDSSKQFKQIVETAQEGIWMLDEHNLTKFVNNKLCRILEYSVEEMIGKSPQFFIHQKQKHTIQKGFNYGKQPQINSYEVLFETKSGRLVWLNLSTNPLYDEDENYKGALAMVTDMTERRRLEEKIVRQKVQQQKEITKAALQAQESERNFLGSELHDNINQILTAVKLQLKYYLENKCSETKIVENSHKHLDIAIEEIRKLSQRLVTHRFDVDSFIDELNFLLNRLPIKDIIELNVSQLNEEIIPENIKLTLFRIIQEQLNNIVKYANATSVSILIGNDDEHVKMCLKDNGVGFNVNEKRKGVGITNIYNRVESYNGNVSIESMPGKGCQLILSIPLQQPLFTQQF